MGATGPHTYQCDGCLQELDGNGMIVLRDTMDGSVVHFHSYEHVKPWADRRHGEHTAALARSEAETAERVAREAQAV